MRNNPWINPSADVVRGGFKSIVSYWEACALSGSSVSWNLKVVLVGAVKAGKTSLVKGMIQGTPRLCDEDDRTKGVEVHVNEPHQPDPEQQLRLIFWDFAGHPEYYSTHQIFLSEGALHLLVVDLERFSEIPSARNDLVCIWLNVLQSRVPGSNVLVVATKIDKLSGDFEKYLNALDDLRRTVENHPSIKDSEHGLVFHGVETVSSARSKSLSDLRFKLSSLVYGKKDMFPSVGRKRPVSWVRVFTMLDAKRSGGRSLLDASRLALIEGDQGDQAGAGTPDAGEKCLPWEEAMDEWTEVVKTLKLEKEMGLNVWDCITGALCGDTGRNDKLNAVFEDAVGQLVREGTILNSGGILYLEPTWINKLLRAITDHDLTNENKRGFWENELVTFCKKDNEVFSDLKNIHDNFPSTGVLSVKYLRFLWREVAEIRDNETLFESLLEILSRHGVIFRGNPSDAHFIHREGVLYNSPKLFVPLNLPPSIRESDQEEYERMRKYEFRQELVYEIHQTYLPPGFLGLMMGWFLFRKDVQFRRCWKHGTYFALGGGALVLLYLDAPSNGEDKALITVELFGEKYADALYRATKTVQQGIKTVFVEFFPGLMFNIKNGYPREIEGKNAVVDWMEARVLEVLRELETKHQKLARKIDTTLSRLNQLQSKDVPCPSLVIIRPATYTVSGGQNRSLRTMFEGFARGVRTTVCEDMRLYFLCPYDLSEMPCGLDGNGYPFTTTREWVKKILPALKVTAMLAKVAIRSASGVDLEVSEFLNNIQSYLGEELANRVPDDDVIEKILDGRAVPDVEASLQPLVGKAYEELKLFMDDPRYQDTTRYVHFDKMMELVDGDNGQVWVSKVNAQLWKNARI